MDQVNWQFLFVTPIIPIILGFLWYHPKVFGTRIATNAGLPTNKIGILGSPLKIPLMYLFGLSLSYIILLLSVHQIGPFLLFFGEERMADSSYEAHAFLKDFMDKFGTRHRSFGHGILHGAEIGVFTSLSLIGTTALLEGRSMKKSWIHIGFWIVCSALIGGVLAANF